MLSVRVHLSFKGNCREAFQFYEKTLGGKIRVLMTWGKSPMAKDVPAAWADQVMHGTICVGETEIAGADAPADKYQKPQGVYVILNMNDISEADRIFAALSDGGTVAMPIQETFWALRFGMVTDRFGTPWMINCGKAH